MLLDADAGCRTLDMPLSLPHALLPLAYATCFMLLLPLLIFRRATLLTPAP